MDRMIIILLAIWHVETNCSQNLKDNGDCVGPMQITKVFVDDVNRILNARNDPTRKKDFTYEDRNSKIRSFLMATVYIQHYIGDNADYKDMASLYHCGKVGMIRNVEERERYWEKIKLRLVELGVKKEELQ